MTDVAAVLAQRPQPKRNQWGQYVLKGKAYPRVTTIAGTLEDRFNLERWQQRMVALGLGARHDLYARVAACRPDDKDELGKLCEAAIEAAKGTAGANLGTALHAFTERIDLGEEISIPAPYNADIDVYRSTLATHGIGIERDYVERIVINHALHVAGTFDRLVTVPNVPDGCDLLVADLKTPQAESLQFFAISQQLAAYAYAEELYDPATDTTSPMPFVNKDYGLVIHLPAGQAKCTLHLVDLKAGWEMAQTAVTVRAWRKRKDLSRPFVVAAPAPAPPEQTDADVAMRDWLRRRVEALRDAGHLDALAARWPVDVPTFKAAAVHTAAQLRAIELAVRVVEVDHNMPALSMHPLAHPVDAEAMVTRLKALDPAALATVTELAGAAGLPHVKRMTEQQLGQLGVILAGVEADALRAAS